MHDYGGAMCSPAPVNRKGRDDGDRSEPQAPDRGDVPSESRGARVRDTARGPASVGYEEEEGPEEVYVLDGDVEGKRQGVERIPREHKEGHARSGSREGQEAQSQGA